MGVPNSPRPGPFGLPYIPDRRLSVTLPEGTAVKSNKVVGGAPGYGELRGGGAVFPNLIGSELVVKTRSH